MKRIVVILCMLLIGHASWSQEVRIDESEINIEHIEIYLAKAKGFSNEDSVYHYYNRALLISEEVSYNKGEAEAYRGLIDCFRRKESIYDELRYSLLLVAFLDEHGTDSERASAGFELGKIYYNQQLFDKSGEVFKRSASFPNAEDELNTEISLFQIRSYKKIDSLSMALIAARKLQDKPNKSLKHSIDLFKEKAEIYHKLKAYSEELGAYTELLELISGTKYEYMSVLVWNNIGYVNKYLGRLKDSKRAFMNVVNSDQKLEDDIIGGAHYNLGLNFQNALNPDSSMYHFNEGIRFLRKSGNADLLAKSYNMQAMLYFQQSDLLNAQQKVDNAIAVAEREKLGEPLAHSYEIQTFISQELFEYEAALDSYKKFLFVRDSIRSIENDLRNKREYYRNKFDHLEREVRVKWTRRIRQRINDARKRAEREKEAAIMRSRQKSDSLDIARLTNDQLLKAKILDELMLNEQELMLRNQENELKIVQSENRLKELALEQERLVSSEHEKQIEILAQRTELERQRRMRQQEELNNKLRFAFSLLFFFLLVLLGILIAYRQLRKRKKQIEQQSAIIAQSKIKIEEEKEKADGLLLNILPTAVAEELKKNGSSKPKFYDEVSVGFTDFAGFTKISEQLSPEELVQKLDDIFLGFDKIIEEFNLQRIKTIGDAYMFASGLPEPMENHALLCVKAGLKMRDFVKEYNEELEAGSPHWNIRIGINTGPVVAGVIGIKKFAYDIWGDTVNTAARMESSGEVGKINISGSTYQLVNSQFKTEYRGKVHAKNKGDIDMYFVEGSVKP